jgi:DNA uptake protein ComE-like DNA-binding protein
MLKLLPAALLILLSVPLSPAQSATNPQPTVSQKIAADAHKLDINSATADQLKTLPGINNTFAARIIAGRPYTEKNQLIRRGIINQQTYNAISDKIIAHRIKPRAPSTK